MKQSVRKAFLYIVMLLFIATMFTASLTFGRYISERNSESDYSGDIEYILSDAIVISTIDDFFKAIENGYSNIQIGEELDNPLIISGGISDVRSDLTIDLNGHEIQRNNRQPLLNIQDGVTLTIIDSSKDKTGSLYNPVGSVLQLSGGTLTVAAGIFESGPRSGERDASGARDPDSGLYDEYALGGGTAWSSPNGGSFTATNRAVLYEKNGAAYSPAGEQPLPVIQPKTVAGANNNTVNGNMYFDERAAADIGGGIICGDTYLYFTFEADNMEFSTVANNGSADYYYEYYVKGEQADGTVDFKYVGADRQSETDVLVTVYVYNNVKGSADGSADAEGSSPPKYAAINMGSGNLYARAGHYYSYFGKADTYCVSATGGYMAVSNGYFNAFGHGVCVECAYGSSSGANEYLNISRGDFYSEVGDTVRVSDARAGSAVSSISIGTAYIVKDSSAKGYAADSQSLHGSAIKVTNGNLKISSGADIRLYGSGMNGIFADGGHIEAANAEIRFNDVSSSDGQYAVEQYGAYNFGIFARGGSITLDGNTGVYVSGTDSAGVYSTAKDGATQGSNITIGGTSFNCAAELAEDAVLSATAVSTAGGNIIFKVGTATIRSQGLGITASNIVRDSQSGRPVQDSGSVSFVQAPQGESRTVTVNTPRGTGVYVYGGAIAIGSGVEFTVESDASQNKPWQSGQLSAYSADGIYVRSGSLISDGTLKVYHTGVENDEVGSGMNKDITDDLGYAYRYFAIKSFAVRVEGSQDSQDSQDTTVTLNKANIQSGIKEEDGTIKAGVGGGLYVSGGTVTLGDAGTPADDIDITIKTTGTTLYETGGNGEKAGYYYVNNAATNWSAKMPKTGGHAVQVDGGKLTVYGGEYTSALGNGILVSDGTAVISGGTFNGNDVGLSAENNAIAGAAASYGFKMYGGTVTTYGGTFGGSGSGAFVMGTGADDTAEANIYGGNFAVDGQAGFSAYKYVTVNFEPEHSQDGFTGSDVTVSGTQAGLTLEKAYTETSGEAVVAADVTIKDGTFSGTASNGDGVWYGEGAAKLKISCGTFNGNRSGLYFEVAPNDTNDPNDENVQLSGGTYTGGDPALHYGVNAFRLYPYYTNGAIGANASRGAGLGGPSTGAVVYLSNVLASGTASGSGRYDPLNMNMVHTDWACYKTITIKQTIS